MLTSIVLFVVGLFLLLGGGDLCAACRRSRASRACRRW